MSGTFVVAWPGWCPNCDEAIRVGDTARYDDDHRLVHAGCYLHGRVVHEIPVVICPRCHLTRPCEHDDG